MIGNTRNINYNFDSLNGLNNNNKNNKINIYSKNISQNYMDNTNNYDLFDVNASNSNVLNINDFLKSTINNSNSFTTNSVPNSITPVGNDLVANSGNNPFLAFEKGMLNTISLHGTPLAKKFLNELIDDSIKTNPFSFGDKFARAQMEDFLEKDAFSNYDEKGEVIDKEYQKFINNKKNLEIIKKYLLDLFKKNYYENMKRIQEIDKEKINLQNELDKELDLVKGDSNKISQINEEYQLKFDDLEQERTNCLERIANGEIDPNKIEVEKDIFGSTSSEVSTYASSSAVMGIVAFFMKEVTTFFSSYIKGLNDGKSASDSLEDAIKATTTWEKGLGVNASEAVGLGLGNFLGLMVSKGSETTGSALAVALSNTLGMVCKILCAGNDEELDRLIHDELPEATSGTIGAIASIFFPFISGVTGNIVGKDAYGLFKTAQEYPTLDKFIAQADTSVISSKILELSGAVIGDLIEYKMSNKSIGVIGSFISAGGSFAGSFIGKYAPKIGEWYYDVENALENFGGQVYDFQKYTENELENIGGQVYDLQMAELKIAAIVVKKFNNQLINIFKQFNLIK